MSDSFQIRVNERDFNSLIGRYGENAVNNALRVTSSYTAKVQSEARSIIRENNAIDSGRLLNSIQTVTSASSGKIAGQVNAAAKYARFIHEGAKHEGEKVVEHFVSFSVAPSLLKWAKRNKVIYQKTNKGTKRKNNKAGDAWFMQSSKSGKEYRVYPERGGLLVKQEPLEYLTKPFNNLIDKYLQQIANVFSGGPA